VWDGLTARLVGAFEYAARVLLISVDQVGDTAVGVHAVGIVAPWVLRQHPAMPGSADGTGVAARHE
jgi:hypothetical protein